jgi:hypothetical protein
MATVPSGKEGWQPSQPTRPVLGDLPSPGWSAPGPAQPAQGDPSTLDSAGIVKSPLARVLLVVDGREAFAAAGTGGI